MRMIQRRKMCSTKASSPGASGSGRTSLAGLSAGRWAVRCTFVLAAALACVAGDAAAQHAIPDSAQPGRIEKRFEQPLVPKSLPEVHIRTERQIPPDKAGLIRFVLTAIVFEGNTVFTQSDFLRFYEKMLGKTVTLNNIYMIADSITAFYRNQGYILSRAVVPPQEITEGIVRIKIVEGFINDVIIEGDVRGRAALFEEWAKKIKQSRPLNIKVLERYTLLADDLPGAIVKAVLRPAKTVPAAADLVLAVTHKTFDASIGYDNRGTKTSGPGQMTLVLGANSLLHLYEQTHMMYVATEDFHELHYFVLSHEETLTSEGTKLRLTANHSRTEPGSDLQDFDIRGRGTSYGIGITQPFIRARSTNLNANLDFIVKEYHTDTLDEPQSEDRIRVLTAGITYDFADPFRGVNIFNLEVHQGLDIFNASKAGSENLSRADGRSDFTKLTAEVSRSQYLAERLGLLVAARGQYAFNSLLSSEEFGYGGSQYGRAYDPSEITGDHGMSVKAEIQYTGTFRNALRRYIDFYQLYGFSDYGAVYNRSSQKSDHESGASAGIGVRFALIGHLAGYLEIDKPLHRGVAAADEGKGYDPRIFFSIAARY